MRHIDFPASQPIEFKQAWLREMHWTYQALLGNLLATPDRDAEIEACLQQLEEIAEQEFYIQCLKPIQ